MFKKSVLFLAVVILMAAFNMGLLSKKINLDYIKTPSAMLLAGNQYEAEMTQLSKQYNDLKSSNGSADEQQAIAAKYQELANSVNVQTDDKEFIDKLLGEIKNEGGFITHKTIINPKSGLVLNIQFGYNNLNPQTMDELVAALKEGYIPSIYLFPNDVALIPTYDNKTPNSIGIVEVKLNSETIKYINDYYNSRIKK